MRMLLTAIVLAIAAPAGAQTASADPHAGHTPAQHQAATAGHGGHGAQGAPSAPMDHSKMDHSKHEGCCPKGLDGKGMPCCEKMKAAGGKMGCCEKAAGAKGAADPHASHDMSKQ